jgi:hypothetical protein
MKDHRQYFESVILEAQQYQGLLFMMPFQTTDEEFQQQRDYLRWSVHQQTLNARLTDEKLGLAAAHVARAALQELGDRLPDGYGNDFELIISRHFEIALRETRNALQEPLPPPNPLAPAAKPA